METEERVEKDFLQKVSLKGFTSYPISVKKRSVVFLDVLQIDRVTTMIETAYGDNYEQSIK